MRWSHLVRHGLIGTSLVAAAPAHAEKCDDDLARSVALVIGIDLWPRAALIGGLEARACITAESEVMMRLELGGRGGVRVIAGVRGRPLEGMLGFEGGGTIDLDGTFGLHLAMSYGENAAYVAAQGLFPILGKSSTPRESRASFIAGAAPLRMSRKEGRGVPGRPLIVDGRPLHPAVIGELPALRSAEARAVRDHFVSSARNEYSSVWTFLRLAAELAAVGAPAALIVRALDAADDEVRHAELCSGAAGGVDLAPLAMHAAHPRFAARTAESLAILAVEAWCEGCLGESAAAEEARLATDEAQGSARAMLATIARDEAGHAALAWAVLAWTHAVAPATVEAALARVPTARPVAARRVDPALARHGVPTAPITQAAHAIAASTARARFRELVG